LAKADLSGIGLQDARQQLAEALDLSHRAEQVVVDVAEVLVQIGVDDCSGRRQAIQRHGKRHDRSTALQRVLDGKLEQRTWSPPRYTAAIDDHRVLLAPPPSIVSRRRGAGQPGSRGAGEPGRLTLGR